MDGNQELRATEAERWWQLRREFTASAKEYGSATVKSLVTINGGAIIAILSFVAAGIQSGILDSPDILINIKRSLACFGIGLTLSVVVGAIGYINFLILSNTVPGPHQLLRYARDGEISGWNSKPWMVEGTLWLAVALVAITIIVFLVGAHFALQAITMVEPA